MSRIVSCVGLCVAILVSSLQSTRAADLQHLLTYLPADSNALVIVNAGKIFNSEFAKQIAWKQEYEAAYAASPLLIPPQAQMFVMSANIDFEFFRPNWEVAVAEVANNVSIKDIEQKTRGQSEQIAQYTVVETLRDTYIVRFGGNVFGIRKPANRQTVSRWLNDIRSRQSVALTEYLRTQADYPEKVGTEIIMAFDLHDVIHESSAAKAMTGSTVVKNSSVTPEQVGKILGSVRGLTLGVRITDRIYGSVKLDFNEDASALNDIAGPLMTEIFQEGGAMINDFASWKGAAKGKTIAIQGELSRDGLKKIFSFLQVDSRAVAQHKGDGPDEAQKPYLTKQYFDSIQGYLDGLKHEKNAVSFGQIGLWFDKYATKVENLPTLHVDDDMVDYGMWVAQQLRDATAAIQGVGIRSAAEQAQVTTQVTGNYNYSGYGPYNRYGAAGYRWRPYGGGYGSYNWEVDSAAQQKRAIRYQERATGATQARELMANVRAENQKIRRKMTERYEIQF